MPIDTTSWTIGFVVAAVVVVVVAVVVLAIIALATRIRNQVGEIIAALGDAERGSAPLWEAHTTVRVGHELFDLAQQARQRLGGRP
jgi:hypothetical protein